jgi:hypothetical protein
MKTILLATTAFVVSFVPAYGVTINGVELKPAIISAFDPGIPGTVGVDINGDILTETVNSFKSAVKDCCSNNGKNVIVRIKSEGGQVVAANAIATYIKDRGWQTLAQEKCKSSCTYIWLAGSTRWVAEGTIIGFHQTFDIKHPDKPDKIGNDLARKVYTSLGLSKKAIDWALQSRKITRLTPAIADEFHISYKLIDAPTVKELPVAVTGNWCWDDKAKAYNRVAKPELCEGKPEEEKLVNVEPNKLNQCNLQDIQQLPDDIYRVHSVCADGLDTNYIVMELETGRLIIGELGPGDFAFGVPNTSLPDGKGVTVGQNTQSRDEPRSGRPGHREASRHTPHHEATRRVVHRGGRGPSFGGLGGLLIRAALSHIRF